MKKRVALFFGILLIINLLTVKYSYCQTAEEYFNSGLQFHRQGQYEEALWALGQAIALAPQSAHLYLARGRTYEQRNQLNQALADFEYSLQLTPQNLAALAHRALLKLKKGFYHESLQDFKVLTRLDPQSGWNFMMQAEAKYLAKEQRNRSSLYTYYEIVDDYTQAIRRDPSLGFAFRRRAQAQLDSLAVASQMPSKAAWEAACNDLFLAQGLGDGKAGDLRNKVCGNNLNYQMMEKAYQLAQKKQTWQNTREAYQLYDYVVQLGASDSPYLVKALFKRAEIKTQAKDYNGAIQDYTLIIALQNEKNYAYQVAYFQRGLNYRQMNLLNQALNDFEQAISAGYDQAKVYLERGNLYQLLKQPEKACEDWQISADKGNSDAQILRKEFCPKKKKKRWL
jgi:tetratricopeptide (TPR) repeat protein